MERQKNGIRLWTSAAILLLIAALVIGLAYWLKRDVVGPHFAFLLSLCVYLAFSVIYFAIERPSVYHDQLKGIRKIYYLYFLMGLAILISFQPISLKDWPQLLPWGALFVFIDLAIFQTPHLSKFFNAEFIQHAVL